jgi:hypothetical protein
MRVLNTRPSTSIPSVSLCTPKTLSHLLFKERRSVQSGKHQKSNKNNTNPSNVKVFTECMEFGEASFIEEIYSDKKGSYETFSKKFQNNLIDANGNPIVAGKEKNNDEDKMVSLEKEEARKKIIKSYSSKKDYDKATEQKLKELNEENKKILFMKNYNSGSITNIKSMVSNVNKSTMSNVLDNLLEKSKQEIMKHYENKIHRIENENYVIQDRLLKEK